MRRTRGGIVGLVALRCVSQVVVVGVLGVGSDMVVGAGWKWRDLIRGFGDWEIGGHVGGRECGFEGGVRGVDGGEARFGVE